MSVFVYVLLLWCNIIIKVSEWRCTGLFTKKWKITVIICLINFCQGSQPYFSLYFMHIFFVVLQLINTVLTFLMGFYICDLWIMHGKWPELMNHKGLCNISKIHSSIFYCNRSRMIKICIGYFVVSRSLMCQIAWKLKYQTEYKFSNQVS